MNKIMGFLNWLKHAFQGENGTASSRRWTAFAGTLAILATVAAIINSGNVYYLVVTLVILCLFVLLLYGIVTLQQVTALSRSITRQPADKEPPVIIETKTESTTILKKDETPKTDTTSSTTISGGANDNL